VSLVLDSSVTLAWIYEEEESELATEIFERVAVSGAWVPSLWRLEVANGLRTGLRQGRIDRGERDLALADLAMLQITVDLDTDFHAWSGTLGLSDRCNLSVYDAAYVELAQRRSLPLASFDEAMRQAARTLGLDVI